MEHSARPDGRPDTRRSPARRAIAAALALAAIGLATRAACGTATSTSPPDALWRIVATCFDRAASPDAGPYCACPAMARSCCADRATPDAAVVWATTPDFVAIRDMKACGCAPDFVAGLALPRARVTGIEDPSRPDGIWPFAWSTALTRIPDELEIGLAINPVVARSQNQLHVHILRLKPGVRARLDATLAAAPPAEWTDPPAIVLRLPDLEHVFTTVAARVGDAAMGLHGILVARAADGGWVAVITDRSSPQADTQNRCTALP